ncbi:MAG TPA: SIS domain-containing protein [Terriglobales bacterium]|nr:SIS domain-containing protein [Terriglobales bacterium]
MSGLTIIEGPYLRDILDQPRALRETIAGLKVDPAIEEIGRKLGGDEFDRVVLTGMGSSYHALHPLNLVLGQLGRTPVMVETSELIHYQAHLLTLRTLVVAVSQSGRSVEMVRLLELNRKQAALVGVTNYADSPLGTESEAAIVTRAGEESTVSCKTYVSSLVALRWLASIFAGDDTNGTLSEMEAVVPAVEGYLRDWKDHCWSFAKRLEGIEHMFVVGRGTSLAAVGTGALTIKESDHFHAEGMSSAAFRHGPMEMLNEGTFVVIFAGDSKTRELNRGMYRELKERGVRCAWIGEDSEDAELRLPTITPALRPVMEILPMQMITLGLAANANREAGKFEHATKITTVE